jgi:hypothetical protein
MGVLTVEVVPLARLFPSPTNPRRNDAAVVHFAASPLRRFAASPLRSGVPVSSSRWLPSARAKTQNSSP